MVKKNWLIVQKLLIADGQNSGNHFELDIGDKAFAAFDALHGVFVQIQSRHLQQVGQFSLGRLFRQVFPNLLDFCPANVIDPAMSVGFAILKNPAASLWLELLPS